MEIVKINPKNPSSALIKEASSILKEGGVIVYPTDTVYGLGVDATNKKAIEKVYKIKGRTFRKPLLVIVSNIKMAEKFCEITQTAKKLIKKFWPGAVSFVLRKNEKGRRELKIKGKTIGLRMPKSPISLEIAKKFGRPFTSTSANLAKRPPCYSLGEIQKQFGKKKLALVNLMLDCGYLPKRETSTIIDLSSTKPKILREGLIKKEKLKVYLESLS